MARMEQILLSDGEISLKLLHVSSGQSSSGYVPVYYFRIQQENGEEVGQCDLRVGHNERIPYAGNIGYSVWKRFRGSHYAAKACLLLFQLARQKGLRTLIITCDPENYASRRTCEIVGGVLQGIIKTPKNSIEYQLGKVEKCQYLVDLETASLLP